MQKPRSSVIDGERIYLRELRPDDVTEAYCRWMNDPHITQYTDSRNMNFSIDSLREYVKEKYESKTELFLAIIEREDNCHIGNIKLGPINLQDQNADIGIIIGEKQFWAKGYATEAIGLLKNHAFFVIGLHKLTAGSLGMNTGSIKAFQNNGFKIEGIRKEHVFFKGSFIDTILLGLINE
ncbi:MAG: GNAT family protein [Thermodesulfobacteriota bacterium]|nr:GNAT family protein [Thermodesulfobacteriota bacterium]